MYELVNEDVTRLGGPMAMESTSIRWNKFFRSIRAAKAYAESDYKITIPWKGMRSDDLGSVMYHIRKVRES